MVDGTKQFGKFNTLQQRFLGEIHCFPLLIVSLTLLCGIFEKHCFRPLFIVHVFTVQISH